MRVITPKESLTRETVTAFLQDNTANTLDTIFHLLEAGDDWEAYLDQRRADRDFTKGMEDYINTIGLPMFSEILGEKKTIEKITVQDTKTMLKYMQISDPAPGFNEYFTALQNHPDKNIINENTKIPVLAYMSSVIGNCMLGKATFAAATVKNNMAIHLDISTLFHDVSNPPKKPGLFTKLFSSKEDYATQKETYKNRSEEISRFNKENEALSAVNHKNYISSQMLAKKLSPYEEPKTPQKDGITAAEKEAQNSKQTTPVVRATETENHMEMGNN